MLEKMDAFFEKRLDGYDEHMLTEIESATEFYPFTASLLPLGADAHVLDLGCGTGLELEFYFRVNPQARVTGIDLSSGMLEALRRKFPQREIELVCGSYFEVPLEENAFDAAVSVESLHHFTQAEKQPLYAKLCRALKPGGTFVLTDYFAVSDEDEAHWRSELIRMKREQGIADNAFYHYYTPLTVAHETEALLAAGFAAVEHLNQWENTHTLRAVKAR